MTKRDAITTCKATFPDLLPAVASGFATSDGSVMIPLHSTDHCLLLYHRTDLIRARDAINAILKDS